MKIFERDEKINFVDINNVFVGFDSYQSCCEHFGYFFKNTVGPYDNESCAVHVNHGIIEDYVFDTTFCFFGWYPDSDNGGDASVTFKLTCTDKEDLYLTLFNHHNGYYSHGFQAKNKGQNWQNGSL